MCIDYSAISDQFPWVVEENLNCVLSPDSDGFLCGLLMTNMLNWAVKGFYDGKVLVTEDGVTPEECVFLDIDINRREVRSVGHHVVLYNKRLLAELKEQGWFQYDNCVQPNNMRCFDGKQDFQRKYPFGTIHLLIGILHDALPDRLEIAPDGIWPLMFTDGVSNNLFGYPENCLEWIQWLRIVDSDHILNRIFCGSDYSVHEIMQGLNSFFRLRDRYNASGRYRDGEYSGGGANRRTGHNMRISNTQGEPINLVPDEPAHTFHVHEAERERVKGFISEMSRYIGWEYRGERWAWDGLCVNAFRKQDFSKTRLNNATYKEMMSRQPFSLAMTRGDNIEYTLVSEGR
jgi:hypothetical protein